MQHFRTVLVLSAACLAGASMAGSRRIFPPASRASPPGGGAQDNNLFINLARKALKWDEPAMPLHIVWPALFRRDRGPRRMALRHVRGADPPQNTAMPQTAGLVEASIGSSGFDPAEIKIIINGHAHSDHAGAIAHFKQLSGAQLAVMRG